MPEDLSHFFIHFSFLFSISPWSLLQVSQLNRPLKDDDPELYDLIQKEKHRQFSGLELIASEV